MGIPAFYGWLSRKYRKISRKRLDVDGGVDRLYLDVNGLIHQACQSEGGVYLTDEGVMIARMLECVEKLMELTDVRELVFLAIDGVAPRAKLNQQRARRFEKCRKEQEEDETFADLFDGDDCEDPDGQLAIQSAQRELAEVKKGLNCGIYDVTFSSSDEGDLGDAPDDDDFAGVGLFGGRRTPSPPAAAAPSPAEPHDQPDAPASVSFAPPEGSWDSNAITPGTVFMGKVAVAFREWAARQRAARPGLGIIISDSDVPGEGEHKFMDFMRYEKAALPAGGGAVRPATHAVVSSDADILLLALSLHLPKVYVVREDRRAGFLKSFEYVSIDMLRECLVEEISGRIDKFQAQVFQPALHSVTPRIPPDTEEDERASPNAAASIAARTPPQWCRVTAEAFAKCRYDPALPAAAAVHEGQAHPPKKTEQVAILSEAAAEGAAARIEPDGGALLPLPPALPDFERVLTDVILCFTFVGNDFLPHLPSAYVGQLTGEVLMDTYVRHMAGHAGYAVRDGVPEYTYPYLTTASGGVDTAAFAAFLEGYAKVEDALFRQEAVFDKTVTEDDAMEAAKTGFGAALDDVWKGAYYRSVHAIAASADGRASAHEVAARLARGADDALDVAGYAASLSAAWFEGLVWVHRYYNEPGTASWRWFYPHYHAPFASDLLAYLRGTAGDAAAVVSRGFDAAPGRPLAPAQQLLAVLPPDSFHLVPPAAQEAAAGFVTSPAGRAGYARAWAQDLTGCRADYHGVPVLPFLDIDALVAATASMVTDAGTGAGTAAVAGVYSGPRPSFRHFAVTRAGWAEGLAAPHRHCPLTSWHPRLPHSPIMHDRPLYVPWVPQPPPPPRRQDGAAALIASWSLPCTVAVVAVGLWRARRRHGGRGALIALAGCVFALAMWVRGRRPPQVTEAAAMPPPREPTKKEKRRRRRHRYVPAVEFSRPARAVADWICTACLAKNWEQTNPCFRCGKPAHPTDRRLYLPKSNRWSPTCYTTNHLPQVTTR